MTAHTPLDTTAAIETPEHVSFHYRLAGPGRRAVAWLIDLIVRGAIMLGLLLLLGLGGLFNNFDGTSTGVLLVVAFCLEWGYFIFFDLITNGRSPGKKALNLRVVREDGTSIRFGDSVLRNLLRAADFLPMGYAVGVLVCGLDARFRRLGDLAAGTIVVAEERTRVRRHNDAPKPTAHDLNAIPSNIPLSRAELAALELFVSRLGTLHPARELDLAQLVAPIFARRIGIATPTNATRFLILIYHRVTGG